ncbi:MAG: DUF2442 domain-containing protein [Rhodanobacter sp.]
MNKPPLIRTVKTQPPMTLMITWSTGETLPVDVSRLIKRFKLYASLRDPAHFRKAKADAWGHAVLWPGKVDMGADQIYELAREQAGEWGHERFAAWMTLHGLSLNTAADALGLSRRMMAHYRTGSRPIPHVVALACEALSARWNAKAA